jgi:predicted aminopeptidase
MVETALQPLVVRLKNDTRPTAFAVAVEQDVSREVLERSVLRELIERDGRYRQHAEAWATLMMDVKERALARSNPADIVDLLKALP